MTRREHLTGWLVALAIVASPGLAGVLVTALTGPDRLDAPTTSPTSAPEGEAGLRWEVQRPEAAGMVSGRRASRSRGGLLGSSNPATGTLPLVLLRIRGCESGSGPHSPGDYRAENPTSTASGAFQILDGTWDGYAGVSHAAYASVAAQDARALQLYRDRGTQPWNATRGCWA